MATRLLEERTTPRQALRVLFVEDSPADVELCLRELEKAEFDVSADIVETPEEFAERLREKPYEIILADYRLPNWTGMEALEILREHGKDIPLILVTGSLGEEMAVECVKKGVSDYVLKHQLARLPVAVRRALEEKALRDARAWMAEVLQDSEASFRLLFANNPHPMWVYDLETLRFLEVNEAAIAHYGYSRDEFRCMRITDIQPPEDAPRLLEFVGKDRPLLQSSGPWQHRLKDGRIICAEITSHVLQFAWRSAALVVAQDITERKRAEAENLRLITAIEQSAEGILITDPDGRIQYVNPAFTRITGYRRQEALGQNPRLLKSGKHDRLFYQNLWHTILTGRTWRGEMINRRKDGSFYTEESAITPVQNERGVITHFIAIKQDITERKRAEEALRASEARYRELVENATYGIYRSALDGALLDVNPAMVAMLGYESRDELLAVNLVRDIYRETGERARVAEQSEETGRIKGVEVEWKRKDGRLITVELSGRAVRDENGAVEGFEVIAEDVTERRALEKQNRELQKFEAIGQLAGGIAHDFNNMIGAMMGWAELGLEEAPAGSRLQRHFQKIRDQAERAAALTQQLLAFARRQILEPRNVNLNHMVAEMVGLLTKVIGAPIEVRTVLAPDLEVARADPPQIEQVLMNLCLNARDAMPGGGCLLIETGNAAVDEEYCRRYAYARPGRYVLLAVSDTGIGMDATTLEHVFEPFFTTKAKGKGTGLGLATTYGIVKQHGGFIHVYSEPGQGTTFRVYLPAGSGEAEPQEKSNPETESIRGGTETILVAEDHEGLREMAREILESLGYQIVLACNGEEAVLMFQAHGDRIALVLLDVVMPKLSGPEAYAQMRARKPGLPAIFATGYSSEAALLNSLLEKGAAVLQKPYSLTNLGRKVRELLDRPAPG